MRLFEGIVYSSGVCDCSLDQPKKDEDYYR